MEIPAPVPESRLTVIGTNLGADFRQPISCNFPSVTLKFENSREKGEGGGSWEEEEEEEEPRTWSRTWDFGTLLRLDSLLNLSKNEAASTQALG